MTGKLFTAARRLDIVSLSLACTGSALLGVIGLASAIGDLLAAFIAGAGTGAITTAFRAFDHFGFGAIARSNTLGTGTDTETTGHAERNSNSQYTD